MSPRPAAALALLDRSLRAALLDRYWRLRGEVWQVDLLRRHSQIRQQGGVGWRHGWNWVRASERQRGPQCRFVPRSGLGVVTELDVSLASSLTDPSLFGRSSTPTQPDDQPRHIPFSVIESLGTLGLLSRDLDLLNSLTVRLEPNNRAATPFPPFPPVGMEAFAAHLCHGRACFPALRTLVLNLKASDAAMETLAARLLHGAFPMLRVLELGKAELSRWHIMVLAHALRARSTGLEELRIEGHRGPAGGVTEEVMWALVGVPDENAAPSRGTAQGQQLWLQSRGWLERARRDGGSRESSRACTLEHHGLSGLRKLRFGRTATYAAAVQILAEAVDGNRLPTLHEVRAPSLRLCAV